MKSCCNGSMQIEFFYPKITWQLVNNVIGIIIIGAAINKLWRDGIPQQPVFSLKPEIGIRKDFSKKHKDETLSRQFHLCAECKQFMYTPEFHHIDGNHSNNDLANCEALCPNCHRKLHSKRLIL